MCNRVISKTMVGTLGGSNIIRLCNKCENGC